MSSSSFKGLSWPQWVDRFIDTKLGGKPPSSKLKCTFTAYDLRKWLVAEGHPQAHQASMFLQLHRHQMRWGTTEYMLRCAAKGPAAYWVVSDFTDAQSSMEYKIDDLSRQHVNDILCRAKRMAEGNHTVDGVVIGGAFVGDATMLAEIKREAQIVMGSWDFMRSTIYNLPRFDFNKSWASKHVVTI